MVDETDEDRDIEDKIDDSSVGIASLISKPRMSSAVCNYFGVKSDSSGSLFVGKLEKPVCKLCEKAVPAKGSNTFNLFQHLESSHPKAYAEEHQATYVKIEV